MHNDDVEIASEFHAEPDADSPRESPQRPQIFWIAVVFEGGLGAVALAVGWLCDFSVLGDTTWSTEALLYGLLVTIPPVIGLLAIDRFPIGPLADLNRVVDKLIVPLFRNLNVLQLLVIAALAGIGEELFFRGLLQGGLEHLISGRMESVTAAICALVVVSALFGVMHAITRMYALLCFLMGIYLGGIWIIDSPRNLLAPIIVHGLYDFVALVYLVRVSDTSRRS